MEEVNIGGCEEQKMPVIGMGTSSWPPADPATAKAAILDAIRVGYRHFDTAFAYGSEMPLGEAIAEALQLGLIKSRDQLFITTKLWSSFAVKEMVLPAIKMSLSNLKLEYVDMYLIHWPVGLSKEVRKMPVEKAEYILPLDMKAVWEGMEECKKLGLTKGIGVSNFSCKKLEELLAVATVPPAVNQVEMNPLWQQKTLRHFCKEKGIHITAFTPLGANNTKWGDNRVVGSHVIKQIAANHAKTPAQVALRWIYEQGVSIVPKSFNKERMKENLDIFDFSLTEEESLRISELPQQKCVVFTNILGPHDICLQLDQEAAA